MSGEGVLYLNAIQIYALLLSCQSKSWRTGFSGPEGELAILNLQANIAQFI